jgi:hypothetical protein
LNRLHLHPDVDVALAGESHAVLAVGELRLFVHALGFGHLRIETGWYCPEFGKRLPAPVLVWDSATSLPAACGWCLSPQCETEIPEISGDPSGAAAIRWLSEIESRGWERMDTAGAFGGARHLRPVNFVSNAKLRDQSP